MWPIITSIISLGIAVLDFVLALGMHYRKSWNFLIAGNPHMPDGQRRYEMEKYCRSAEILLWSYTVSFFVVAIVLLLVRVTHIWPDGILAGTLYVHGTVVIMAAVLHLAYVDSYAQTPEKCEDTL